MELLIYFVVGVVTVAFLFLLFVYICLFNWAYHKITGEDLFESGDGSPLIMPFIFPLMLFMMFGLMCFIGVQVIGVFR